MSETKKQQAVAPVAISAAQAAEVLGISVRLLARLTAAGDIPSVKIGRRRLYGLAALSLWFERQQIGQGAEAII